MEEKWLGRGYEGRNEGIVDRCGGDRQETVNGVGGNMCVYAFV